MIELPDDYELLVPGRARGDPGINGLFDFWQQIMGYPISSDKTKQRRYAHILLQSHDLEDIHMHIRLAREARSDRYAPRIAGLDDLYYKWDKLMEWGLRRGQNHSEVVELD